MHPKIAKESRLLSEEAFVSRLHLEQKRTERSHRPFVLVLLESANLLNETRSQETRKQILGIVLTGFRDTDIRGWYRDGSVIGLIFTEIGSADGHSVGNALLDKLRNLLKARLSAQQATQAQLSFYLFPEDWDKETGSAKAVLYPESTRARRASQLAKRLVDITGSLVAIVLASPIFLAIAVAVKLTSKGPVLFRQQRVGQYGRKFTFLKFRSMRVNNDHAIHEAYVKNLIAGSIDAKGSGTKVFKITDDPRVTRVGKFLRKTSLDEIPQFLNVLMGDMSLVGPRPPIPYEVDAYEIWHRRRLLAVKPGITGLWQVNGRSKTTFDEMVRLDLQYAKSWSIWLDLKILVQTPRAVIAGDGAY